jgi:uncharacterized protein (DUF433 family)
MFFYFFEFILYYNNTGIYLYKENKYINIYVEIYYGSPIILRRRVIATILHINFYKSS